MVAMSQGMVLEEVAMCQGMVLDQVAMSQVLHRVVGVGEGVGQVAPCMGCSHAVWTEAGWM